MTDYFEEVAERLRVAADRRLHLPWYRRIGLSRRRALILAFVSLLLAGRCATVDRGYHPNRSSRGAGRTSRQCDPRMGDGSVES
jgi:hypothetical protein